MKTCAKCGAENLPTATSCRLCAVPLDEPPPRPSQSNVCPECHADNEPGWLFCQQCGNRLAEGEPPARSPQADLRTRIDVTGETSFDKTAADSSRPETPPVDSAPREITPPSPPPPEQKPAPPPSISTNVDVDRDTRIVCDSCGAVQLNGGLFCTSCGEELSALALARKKSREARKPVPSLTLITEGGQDGKAYKLDRENTLIGRNEGEITFPHDGFMSGRHARIIERDGRYFLLDDNSRNGTFIRIHEEVALEPDDRVLIGKQIFKFTLDK